MDDGVVALAPRSTPPAGAPRATYRVQLHAGFSFADAAALSGYFAELGVSHLYLSPILEATEGSTHGYDVVDHGRVDPARGGAASYGRLCNALGQVGVGQLLDIVPNHMAIGGRANRWWWDVLANGPASEYARYFDVDWESPDRRMHDKVLLPILADHYGRELEAGRIRLGRVSGELVVTYFDHEAPLDPATIQGILLRAAARLPAYDEDGRVALERLADVARRVPDAASTDLADVAERVEGAKSVRDGLAELCGHRSTVRGAVDAEIEATNTDIDELDELLDRQSFRLAWWRSAAESLDYRRFFDINDLAALRADEPDVFGDSHRLILGWLAQGVIDGVRVDHVDGLTDPARYLARLADAAPRAWLLVEKILEGDEELPPSWPVHGTTGYDWLRHVGEIFVEPAGFNRLVEGYRAFTGIDESFEELAYHAKLAVLDGALSPDLSRLTLRVSEVCESHRRFRDYGRREIRDALREVAASFAVYRTYVTGRGAPTPEDVTAVDDAVRTAGMRQQDLDDRLLGLLRQLLLGQVDGDGAHEVATRFQQLTGPVMAKALEDTVFYRFFPLSSLCEVGGDPSQLQTDLDGFHQRAAVAQRRYPWGMLATSTHDTKRSEDVRARLSILAEMADSWLTATQQWWDDIRDRASDPPAPDRNTAWLLLQTLVGAWPLTPERTVAYLEKATREAKEHTSWTSPDVVYDGAIRAFATGVFNDEATMAHVEGFVERIRRPGQVVSLGVKLLTLLGPGVPDVYQGSELWDLSLVDPDNRRPVDYALRRRLLAVAGTADLAEVWAAGDEEGLIKLAVVRAALAVRAEHPEWFGAGPVAAYTALRASGSAGEHLVAFARGPVEEAAAAGAGAIALATRWPLLLSDQGGWRDTHLPLPPGTWVDRLAGEHWEGTVAVGELLGRLPVAVLVRTS